MNPHSFPPPKLFTSASKMMLYILRTVYLPQHKPSLALSIDTSWKIRKNQNQKNHHDPKPLSYIGRHNDLSNMGLIFFPARPASSFQQGQRLTCPWCSWAGFCPASTLTAPASKGGETSRAFWAMETASTWSCCTYGSSSLPWPRMLDCSTHSGCILLQILTGGCTRDGIAEDQQCPCRQLQQGRAISE